ncbi:DUF3102 domain-containing protein [Clostridium coskatii]|uniref:Uncharacterized protein n=1 Tax=Clostridium coskatii TaxID=1705578 RepID=A0A166TUB0_9CLOT|nr:DUF3102 domain-containing protein [Clostridium coskatii]OAA94103.1 hypothetical protein WX73_03673 [Clostridium coskatii]OBR96665.1 hypothetical protein CLCOS_08270 [Clostridium coskatii]
MSKKFNMADLLSDKSKGKEDVKEPKSIDKINQPKVDQVSIEDIPINRDVTLIAAEINNIKEKTRKMVLYNSIEIGRRLVEAKQMLAHGEWGKWLKESVDYSQRTANNLMRIFQEYGADQITLIGDNSKSQAFANLSYSQAIALLEIPEDEREGFIEKNDVENMSTRELQKLIKENHKLENKLKMLQEEASKEKVRNKETLTNKEVEIENLRIYIKESKEKLLEAQSSNDNDEIERLQLSLEETQNKFQDALKEIDELKKELNEKPIEVVASVEKVPEEVEKELEDLRARVSTNEPAIKFSIYFKEFTKTFEALINTLSEIRDDKAKEKYKEAVCDIVAKMKEGF